MSFAPTTRETGVHADPEGLHADRSPSPAAITVAERPSDRMGILLDFLDPGLEREFRTQFVASQLKHIRVAIIVAAILMIGFGIIDSFMYGGQPNQMLAWSTKLFVFLPIAAIFLTFTYSHRYIRHAQIVSFLCLAIVASIWTVLISDGLHRYLFLMPNLIASVFYALFLVGLTLKYSAPLTIILCLLYALTLSGFDLTSQMISALIFSLALVLGLLVLCAYQRETVARTLFSRNKERQRTARRHIQENERDLEWLRGLAAFLRHEVRQPVALVRSSLDIMQLHKPSDDIAKQIRNAETGVRHVWNLIDRATRATDLEAFVRQSQARSVDVGPLIGELVEEFTQTYSGVSFAYKPPDEPLLLQIDPDLFREAIANLLNNAASFADAGSEVTISLAREEDTIATTITNAGPAIDEDIDSLFSPFRSTRASDGDDHQGLGLYLVRLVAQHYGGSATLANLEDRQGVVASIVLPSKRPASRPPRRPRIKLRSRASR